jgi:hypothetical protein
MQAGLPTRRPTADLVDCDWTWETNVKLKV